jgi:chromosome segregation ATPase
VVQSARPTVDLSAELRQRDARLAELQQSVSSLQAALDKSRREAAQAQQASGATSEEVRRIRAEGSAEADRLRAELERTRDDLRRAREELEIRRAEVRFACPRVRVAEA